MHTAMLEESTVTWRLSHYLSCLFSSSKRLWKGSWKEPDHHLMETSRMVLAMGAFLQLASEYERTFPRGWKPSTIYPTTCHCLQLLLFTNLTWSLLCPCRIVGLTLRGFWKTWVKMGDSQSLNCLWMVAVTWRTASLSCRAKISNKNLLMTLLA